MRRPLLPVLFFRRAGVLREAEEIWDRGRQEMTTHFTHNATGKPFRVEFKKDFSYRQDDGFYTITFHL